MVRAEGGCIGMNKARSSPPAEFMVRFWGVRGSYPTPGPQTVRYGGNTTCVEIRAAGRVLVLDAGTGIIGLGQKLLADGPPQSLALLFSHLHQDHFIGLPYFTPLYHHGVTCHFFGPDMPEGSFGEILRRVVAPPYFPLNFDDFLATPYFHSLDRAGVICWQPGTETPELAGLHPACSRDEVLRVRYFRSQAHPRDGAVVYRIEWRGRSVVFATDIEGDDGTLARFARKADLLIHDAQYSETDYLGAVPKRGYGHSTPRMAACTATDAQVGELIIFHHDPTYDDAHVQAMEIEARRCFPWSRAAFEGMAIQL